MTKLLYFSLPRYFPLPYGRVGKICPPFSRGSSGHKLNSSPASSAGFSDIISAISRRRLLLPKMTKVAAKYKSSVTLFAEYLPRSF